MSRDGISMQDVFEAADKLENNNITPTIERIRSLLKTGSNTTISKYLRLWKTKSEKTNKKSKQYWDGYKDAIRRMKNIINTI